MGKFKPYFLAFAIIIFFLPLVFGSPTNELYEFPKMYFVYFLGGGLITIFVLEQVIKGIKFSEIPAYIKIYLLSFIVSTLFSMHIYTSVWGYYTRFSDGLMSTLVFFGLYYVARTKLTKSDFENLFKVLLFSVIPVAVVGIFQHPVLVRVYSTFGQPNWLGQFLAMLLPFANYLFFIEVAAPLWFIISVLGFIALWFSYSLSGILAYAFAFIIFLFLYRKTVFAKGENLFKLVLLLFMFGFITITNLGVFKSRIVDTAADVASVTVSKRAPTQRNLSDPGFIRNGLWLGTAKLIVSSPKNILIGTGPETFPYAFQEFRPKELNYSSEWNFVFNKPHNYFLEIPAEQGIFGLAIYLYLYWKILKSLNKKYLPGFAAFAVSNFFGWPSVTTALIFWLYLASLESANE